MDPVILGALIALAGAALGTVIQLVIVHRQRTWSRVESIRISVHKLGASALGYSTTMYQRAHDEEAYKDRDGTDEHLATLGKQINDSYDRTLEGCFDLMACSEPRVASQADSLHHAIVALHNRWVPEFAKALPINLPELDADRQAAVEDLNVLLNMVEPRWWEQMLTFRGPGRARKILAKHRAKRFKDSDSEPGPAELQ